jgi:hypothetical protein
MLVCVDACCKERIILTSDKVCINQANNQEKSQQVRMMDRVYASARKVRVWLGPATDEEIDAVSPFFSTDSSGFDSIRQVMNRRSRETSANNETSQLSLMETFLSRAWFTRRWVLQEVILAREVTVHCGYHQVSWNSFHDGAIAHLWVLKKEQLEYGVHRIGNVAMHALDLIASLDISRHAALHVSETAPTDEGIAFVSILDLLDTYHTAKCVDERDRLYALYGLLPSTQLDIEQGSNFTTACRVDYSMHFSHVYTNFAAAAVESGQVDEIFEHVVRFGGLAQQNRTWPSWVPGWNMARGLDTAGPVFTRRKQRTQSVHIRFLKDLWTFTDEKLLAQDHAHLTYVYDSRALHIRGCTHLIGSIQPSTCDLDAIAYFETKLDGQCGDENSLISKYEVAWLVTHALISVPGFLGSRQLNRGDYFRLRQSHQIADCDPNTAPWIAIKSILGLPVEEFAEGQFDLDQDEFLSEARRILRDVYPFCYEYQGLPTFGIALAKVEPGDFVFRTTRAMGTKCEDGFFSPSICGLIIRPCHQSSSTGPATFCLVGMCIDYCPDVNHPKFGDVTLV